MQVLLKINRPQIGLFFLHKISFKKILVNNFDTTYLSNSGEKPHFEIFGNLDTILRRLSLKNELKTLPL